MSLLPKPNYILELKFDDGITGEISLVEKLATEVFSPLQNKSLFNTARINQFGTAIIWNNTIDLDAESCYKKIISKN